MTQEGLDHMGRRVVVEVLGVTEGESFRMKEARTKGGRPGSKKA